MIVAEGAGDDAGANGRRGAMMRQIGIVLAVAVGAFAFAFGAAPAVNTLPPGSRLAVIDGDTIEIDGAVVDIAGIDAPEISQLCRRDAEIRHCGLAAALALEKMLALDAAYIACSPVATGTVRCAVGDEDLALRLLGKGYALALPGALPAYTEAAAEAKAAGMGLWGARFVEPARWRAGERLDAETAAATRCLIKGVVETAGRRYLVPTDPDYAAVTVDAAAGGRLFCSDEAARAAGFRHRLAGP